MLWFPLLVLTAVTMMFSWITETVYPEVWAVAEQFGKVPGRAEIFCWKMTKFVTHAVAVMWWLVLFVIVFG